MSHVTSPASHATSQATLLDMTYTSLIVQRAIYAVTTLGIPELLKDGAVDTETLARATETSQAALYRLLRALGSIGVLSELPGRSFALTPLSRLLCADEPGSMHAWARFSGEPFYLQAWQEILYSVRTGKPAWEKVHGVSFFHYLRERAEAGPLFDDAMTSLSESEAVDIIAAYDFSRFRTLVDVGGGRGTLLAAILRAVPRLRGVLFDQPDVVNADRNELDRNDLVSRREVVGGDFFAAVPSGHDAYLLKYVVHDWDDERSIAILESCRRAMTAGATLLLVEMIVPPPGESHDAKVADLEMLVLFGSQERTADQYASLLDRACLRLSRVIDTPTHLSILEAVPV